MSHTSHLLKCCAFPVTLFLLVGCHSIGPRQVQIDRASYNEIVRQTDYEQVLTNIVRMSYVEPTSYLKITNLTASYSLSSSISASPNWSKSMSYGIPPSTSDISTSVGLSPSVSYSDSPTISYMPINDSTFVTTMQQPVSFEAILRLYEGGLDDFDLLSKLTFHNIGPLDNASNAVIPKNLSLPVYKEYYQFIALISRMEKNKAIAVVSVDLKKNPCLEIHFNKTSIHSEDAITLKKMLNIPLNSEDIILIQDQRPSLTLNKNNMLEPTFDVSFNAKNIIPVRTRSIYAMMSFLSHSVQIPQVDYQSKIAIHYRNPDGTVFDWSPLMQGVMTIYSTDQEPTDAFVKCFMHKHWFYIKQTDVAAKVTFSLLVRLTTLTAASSSLFTPNAPILTVPVGAR